MAVSFSEKLSDISEKVGTAWTLVKGMLPGGSFQMATVEISGAQKKVFKNLPPAIGDYYRTFFQKYAKQPWIIYEEEVYTFAQALDIYEALGAELMASFGVKAGDRVGIAMRNLPEFLLAFLGITAAGAVAVPLNALWGSTELEYAVKDSACKVLLCDPERLRLCATFVNDLGIRTIIVRGDEVLAQEFGSTRWDDVIEHGKTRPRPSLKGVKPEDDMMIMYTSGSTGFPKGVVHTQRSAGTSMKLGELLATAQPEVNSGALLAVPMFHITALCNVFLWSIPSGTRLVMMYKWDGGKALDLIEQLQLTRFTGVPTMIQDMLVHPGFRPERISTVKSLAAGGAPVPPAQVAKVRASTGGTSSTQGYGLTETMGGVIVNKGVDYLKNPTSCGKPIPFIVEAKIKDPATGQELGEGQRGELCIKTAMNMSRYNNRPEDTAKVIDKQGFFHTGDVAKIEKGFVYILDRLKDLIIRGGENIDCSEVEAALYTHPAVRECSVFGLPDERLGEVVGCAIWITVDPKPTTAEISQHCAGQLAKFKVPLPEHIFFLPQELPKGATGKIDKKGLREKYKAVVGSPGSKL